MLHRYLLRNGIQTRIIFGVRNEADGKVAGHAWLEAEGEPILEKTPPEYVVTYRFPSNERFDSASVRWFTKTKKERRLSTSPVASLTRLPVLRQSFDVEIVLEASRLLNAQAGNVRRCDAPFASGVARVTVPDDIEELNPPPFGCDGGCSRVVPCTVTLLVPLPHGGRSTVTTTAVEVRGRRSAMPLGAGNVVRSITR